MGDLLVFAIMVMIGFLILTFAVCCLVHTLNFKLMAALRLHQFVTSNKFIVQ